MASVLFSGSETSHGPQSLFGCLDAGWRDGSGFWVHPTAADAAIHGAAILHKEARTVSAVDYFAPSSSMLGEMLGIHLAPSDFPNLRRLLQSLQISLYVSVASSGDSNLSLLPMEWWHSSYLDALSGFVLPLNVSLGSRPCSLPLQSISRRYRKMDAFS